MESQRAYRFVQGKDWGFKKFIRRDFLLDEANGLLVDDKLTIYCEVSVVGETVNIAGQSSTQSQQRVEALQAAADLSLSDDLNVLLEARAFADVTLCVAGRDLPCHKAILVARSPVFAAMFSNDLEESKMNRVEIPDFDYDIILEMLRFMYAGRVRQLDTFAAQLLAAADKYQLDKLKALCEECLCANLAVENVCEIIVLSDFHSAESLKQHCIEFINAHAAEPALNESAGWKSLVEQHSHLLAEAFKALAAQKEAFAGSTPVVPRKRLKLSQN